MLIFWPISSLGDAYKRYLSDAYKKNMYVKKVIFKINLKDDLFKTKSGRKLKRKKIYFARKLPKIIDNLHDDHYHVDFGFL